MKFLKFVKRFLTYGLIGLLIEVVWTALGTIIIQNNMSLMGHTSLWMVPVYGTGGMIFQWIHNKIKNKDIMVRAVIWVGTIYLIEYTSGYILNNFFGLCPWYYSGPMSINGFITLTFLPAWMLLGFVFERFHNFLEGEKVIKEHEERILNRCKCILERISII